MFYDTSQGYGCKDDSSGFFMPIAYIDNNAIKGVFATTEDAQIAAKEGTSGCG
jgi:hypothetical protein